MTGEQGQSAFDKITSRKRLIAERVFECEGCGSNLSPRVTKGNLGLSVFCVLVCISAPVLSFNIMPDEWVDFIPWVTLGIFVIFGSLFQWVRRRRKKECRACGKVVSDTIANIDWSSSNP